MSIANATTVQLSEPLVKQLHNQAIAVGLSISELAEKIIHHGLIQFDFSKNLWQEDEPSESTSIQALPEQAVPHQNGEVKSTPSVEWESTSQSAMNGASEDEDDDFETMEEIVARIRALPKDPRNFRPATGTLDDVLAAIEASPVPLYSPSPEEWDAEWEKVDKLIRSNRT
ncbi:MAG: hypothetical protein AAF639_21675 [Chloroflexota bacterium]